MIGKPYLVFSRADRHQWWLEDAYATLDVAVAEAENLLKIGMVDRVCVMEVSGRDVVPMFTFREGAKT